MKPHWYRWWRLAVLGADLVFVSLAVVGLAVARFGPSALKDGFDPRSGHWFAQAPLLFAIPVWLVVFAAYRLYSPERCQNALEEGRRIVTSSMATAVALVMLGFLVKDNPARSWLFGSMILGALSTAIGRKTVRGQVARLRSRGRWMVPTVIVGREQAKAMVEAALADPAMGIEPVAVCGAEMEGITSYPLDAIDAAVRGERAREVVVVGEDLERHEIALAMEVADELPVRLVLLPGLDDFLLGSLQLVTVGSEPGLAVESPMLHGYQAMLKRAVDVACSSLLLVLTSPLLLLASVAIRIESRGPVIFRQERMGRAESTFITYKLRTMYMANEERDLGTIEGDLSFLSKPSEDPRVTRVGRLLRRSSIDELPQLWNVLLGDMSLIGPRPLPLWEAAALDVRRRLTVRPGLTGLWQVSGRSSLSPEERVRLDIVYIQNWNLLLDLSILLRTVPAVIGGHGAY